MKLAALFARYLYQNKQLKLPGIGIFTIDPSLPVPDTADKSFPEFIRQIHYTPQQVNTADEAFINFIRTETGKIKPLAESDLDSFLTDGKILLNISKPFHIEGIGSLIKNKSGQYEFTPGEPVSQRLEDFDLGTDEKETKKKSVFTEDNSGNNRHKLLILAGIIVGIVLVIWGGYSLYNRNNTGNTNNTNTGTEEAVPAMITDSSRANTILDSVKRIISSVGVNNPGTYRFVIERTASKSRALKRYNQLKDNRTDIRMDTKDSTLFTLYFVLPALPSDTARIRDSLKIWYGRKQVFVEP